MKKTNKLISILLVLAMLLSMAPLTVLAASVVASGKFGASGSNLTWSLDSDGVLTVSGSGAMEDFASVSKVPWYSKSTKIKTVVIESGVTNIGKDAFYGISSLVNATISDTVTSIGNRAFSNSGLTNFEFSDAGNLKTIGNSAFNSTQIKNMVIPDGVTTLGSYIFGYGPIKSVTIPASVTSVGNYFFEETSGLNEVIFLGNKEPETIGNTVFLGCSSLAYVSVPADYEGDTFSNMKVSKAAASVAEVNGQGFATLADAISAAQSISGAELKLLSHISIDSGITIESGKFTIDLNGKELFSNGYFLLRIDGADITITDSAGGGIFNATNDQGNIVLEVLSGSANISGGTFNSAGYPATVRDGTLKLTGKDFVLNGNWRIGWYGGSIDLSACTADEVRIQACAEGLQASAVTLPDGWGLFKTNGTPCTDFVKNDIYVAKAGYKVTASVNPAEGGTVEGAGTYSSGATVNLTATAANGYRFVNWTQSGEEVSTSAVYTFTASGNRELTANFEIAPHTHEWVYTVSASGDRIIATCVTDGCEFENGVGGTLTISAPADLYVDGITAKEATIENNLVDTSVAISDITYSAPYGLPPKDAGTYTASVTVGGATATVEFTLLNYAAKVTDKDGNELEGSPYKTFADAITAAQDSEGSTVTLLDDITLTAEQDIRSGKLTLDLNGNNLVNETGRVFYIFDEADFTIKDSGEGGTIETKREYVDCIVNYGKLTVESGIIKGDGGIDNEGVLYFNDGTVEADYYPAITNYSGSTVYVYNGVLKSSDSGAVENGGTLYVYDGEIKGITNSNTVYIFGGTIDRDEYAALNLLGGTVEVTGGSFTGGEWTVSYSDGASLILKGGEFPNGFVVDETTANTFLAEGYYYKDADGKLITVSDDAKVINGYVKVTKGADLSEAVITVDKTEFVYNGQPQAPAVTVTIGGKTLKENVDYAVNARRWENGVPVQWFYYVDAGAYLLTVNGMGDYTGKVEKEFVIKPATVDIIWEGDEFYYTGNPHKVAAKYIDIDGNESNEFELINYVNTNVGVYTATAILADNNYSATEATINHTYEIKWYDGAPDATFSGTKGENGWYTSEVTVTAPEGYAISTLADGIYGSEITFGNEENAVYYLRQTENGYIAKVELGEIKSDLADPTAEIVIGEYKWNTNATAISFGLFFKETKAFSISASDSESGVAKIEYLVAAEEITDFTNVEWAEYTDAVIIAPNSKNIIYTKATDNSGRYVIVNSDGIVLYTDSTLDTSFKDEVVYVLTKNASQSFNLNLNGNTVAYVKIGETVLGTEDYEVLGNMIIVSSDVLENLAAGNYAITVGFNPLGEAYVDGDAPAEVIIPLSVNKADVTVEITDFSKTYDGKPVTADYKISKSSDSSPAASYIDYNETVEYKVKGANDSTYTTEVPVNAGEYTVRITVAETDKINSAVATADFIIEKREVTATATAPDKVYDGTVNLDFSKVVITFDGIVDGDDVSYEIMGGAYASANVAEKVRVAVSYDVSGKDVSNYEFRSGVAIPEAKYYSVMTFASILAKDISDGFIILGEPLTYNGTEQTQTVEKVLPTGTAPEATYTVSGNKATNVGVYLLTVTGMGNFTGEAKIAYEIAVDMNGVDFDQLHVFNVKSTDKERIEYIYNQVHNASTEYADEEKKEEWFILLNNSNELLLMINNVTSHLESYKEEVAGYDVDTVTSDDYDYLESLSESEGQWLFDHSENYTEEEIIEFSQVNAALTKLLIRISDVAKEITRITNAVNSYDEETVKSSDKEDLEQLKADIKALTDGQNITDGEREKLAELDAKLDELIKRIDDTAEEIERIENAVNGYDEESVKSTDTEAIEQLKEDIQNLIDSGNVTEEEIAGLEDTKADADALTDKIAETEQQLEDIKDIENGYNPETVTSDDKAAIEDKIAEIEAVNPDNLTEEQKAEYEEIKAGFEALLEEIAAAEKAVEDIGAELEMFDEKRVTKFWEDEIEALKAKIDELLADENMGEAEKAKLNEYKAQCDNLIEIINTPVKYFSFRFFYLIWDFLVWVFNGILWVFSKIFSC